MKLIFVLKILNASANEDRSLSFTIGSSELGTSPKIGAANFSSISFLECNLLSKRNLRYNNKKGSKNPANKAPARIIIFLGATGTGAP